MSSIFICHSSLDKQFVRVLKVRLERFEIKVWLDEDEIRPGASLMTVIAGAIKEMNYLGIVLSPNSVRSRWVREELEIALAGQIHDAEVKVIPILYKKCEIPDFLKAKKYVDFSTWSRRKTNARSPALLDRLVREVARGIGVDPPNADSWSGRRMIKVCDFRRRVAEHFAPRPVHIGFFDFDTEPSLHFIKVDNDDGTFELYQYSSRPSCIDVINNIFRRAGEPRIVDLEFPDALVWTDDERESADAAICDEVGLPIALLWTDVAPDAKEHEAWVKARKKSEEWMFEQAPISLIHEGDFGSLRNRP